MIDPITLGAIIDNAWQKARNVPGYLAELEFRSLALLAAHAPTEGVIVEIGSFKGKSTIVLASVAQSLSLPPVVCIDPHTSPSSTDPDLKGMASSYDEFIANIRAAGLEDHVEVHRTFSQEAAKSWNRKIRMLWIDGDHTYQGAKLDFDLFSPFLAEGAVIAMHDTLGKNFDGPIRVFVEDILRSDNFGFSGFSHSTGWSQYRPRDGGKFCSQREALARRAARLIPFVAPGRSMTGIAKLRYKLCRGLIPKSGLPDVSQLHLI